VKTSADGVEGVVLSDQVKSLDWKQRRAHKKGCVDASVMLDERGKIKALLQIK